MSTEVQLASRRRMALVAILIAIIAFFSFPWAIRIMMRHAAPSPIAFTPNTQTTPIAIATPTPVDHKRLCASSAGSKVDSDKINPEYASDSCEKAYYEDRNDPLITYYLGRVRESQKRFSEAAKLYRIAGSGGVADAWGELGSLYTQGRLPDPNYKMGIEALIIGHQKGSAIASTQIGLYAHNILKDDSLAESYLKIGIDRGSVHSQAILGAILFKPQKRDCVRAYNYISESARKEVIQSIELMSYMNRNGVCVVKDEKLALKYDALASCVRAKGFFCKL